MGKLKEVLEPSRGFLSLLQRFGLAIGLVAVALGLTLLLQKSVSTAGYVFFYSAVVAGSWFGGKWSGGLAVILSTLAVEYFLTPPIHSLDVRSESLPVFIEFAAFSIIVSWFSSRRREAEEALKRARDQLEQRVEERTAELRQSNRQLLAEIAGRERVEQAHYETQAELARVSRMSAFRGVGGIRCA